MLMPHVLTLHPGCRAGSYHAVSLSFHAASRTGAFLLQSWMHGSTVGRMLNSALDEGFLLTHSIAGRSRTV